VLDLPPLVSEKPAMLRRIIGSLPHPLANALFMLRGALDGAYVQDGFFTAHDAPFRRDPKFREAYRLGHATGSFGKWQVEWRTFVCCWAAKRALALPGDLVECGVNRGGYSRAVAHYVDLAEQPKKLWLLDTFEGLVAEQLTPEERARGVLEAARYPDCYDEVRATFAPFPNVELIKGPVPDTLARVTSETISYLSIDMNCAAPEIAAAEHFWPRLAPGAAVVLDDYGWKRYAAQREAFDAFASERAVPILPLPTGQGLILKP
jgi:O-methyltransferase